MQADPFVELLQPIRRLLDQALSHDLAASLGADIEAKAQKVLRSIDLVPKHEFAAQQALLTTLELQITALEARLSKLEGDLQNGSSSDSFVKGEV